MKICSFNINSIRARPHQLEHVRDTIAPDVIGLQETKVQDSEFPLEMVKELDEVIDIKNDLLLNEASKITAEYAIQSQQLKSIYG